MSLALIKFVEYFITFLTLFVTVFFLLLFIKNRNELVEIPKIDRKWAPRISVIIPAFNEEEYIEKTIRSVLNADYPKDKISIILVDDGSVDNTYKIATAIKDKRLQVFKKKNGGKARALNFGIAKAKTEFIATLDADSYISKSAIWKLLPYFKDPEVVAVTAAIKVMERKKNVLESIQKVEYLFTLFSRKVLTFMEAVPVTPGPFSIFRSWVFKKIGGFDPNSILEDQEIAMRIQKHNYKIRSSMDAEVYTEVPAKFSALIKQRIRWHRGGLHNTIKYLNMISPHYGDFGIIIMPLTFLALLALFSVFILAVLYAFTQPYYTKYLGMEIIWLSLSPVHIIGVFIFALNLLWIGWGLAHFKKEKVGAPLLGIYIIAYSYLLTLYWTLALIKELKFEKISW